MYLEGVGMLALEELLADLVPGVELDVLHVADLAHAALLLLQHLVVALLRPALRTALPTTHRHIIKVKQRQAQIRVSDRVLGWWWDLGHAAFLEHVVRLAAHGLLELALLLALHRFLNNHQTSMTTGTEGEGGDE
jgi:hypothetical protein